MDKVKWSVRRDTLDGKLRDFLEWMEAVKTTTVHHVCVQCICVHACVCVCVCA